MMMPWRMAGIGAMLATLWALPLVAPSLGADVPPAAGSFDPTGSLAQARAGHSATRLPDGRVLVIGGYGEDGVAVATSELWDPASGTFGPAASLAVARGAHTATLLADGRVLVAGGLGPGGPLDSAELWDPAGGTFGPAASLAEARSMHTATRLSDGRVLIAGGYAGADGSRLTSAELWDPVSGTFGPAGSLDEGRTAHTATLLLDGRVLVIGGRGDAGRLASSELWDRASGTFSPAGSLGAARGVHTATLLRDGRVLVVGGVEPDGSPIAAAELWDPDTGTFAASGSLGEARGGHTATLLADDRVLVVGGYAAAGGSVAGAELWDPAGGAFGPAGSLGEARGVHTATLLRDERVLVVGGIGSDDDLLAAAELWEAAPRTAGSGGSVNASPVPATTSTGFSVPERIAPGSVRDLAMVVGDGGSVHVAYTDAQGLWYLTDRDGAWEPRLVLRHATTDADLRRGTAKVLRSPSIALDERSRVTIAFTRACFDCTPGSNDGVFMVSDHGRAAGTFPATPTRIAPRGTGDPSIKTVGDRLYVAYAVCDCVPMQTRAPVSVGVRSPDGTWSRTRLAGFGWDPSLRVDAQGHAHVAFASPDGIGYAAARTVTGDFEVQTLPGSGTDAPWSARPSLALDSADRPHIAWLEARGTDGTVAALHARLVDSGWMGPDTVVEGRFGALELSIDPRDQAHVLAGGRGVSESLLRGGSWRHTILDRDVRVEAVAIRAASSGTVAMWAGRSATDPAGIYLARA